MIEMNEESKAWYVKPIQWFIKNLSYRLLDYLLPIAKMTNTVNR